jgi:hypothetical protein
VDWVTLRRYQLASLMRMEDERRSLDEEREVVLVDDAEAVLPEQTRDDLDRGWGESPASNDERLLDERPPHWD